jgi:hypothetical protein
MDYKNIKSEDIKLDFVNGVAETEIIEGALPNVKSYRGVIKAGATLAPKVQPRVLSSYIIQDGRGYIVASQNVNKIEELSFFFASLDEPFTMTAFTDLTYTKFDLYLSDYDMERYDQSHLVLPLFRKESDCLIYTQNVKLKENSTCQRAVVVGKQMIRVIMGSNHAEPGSGFYEIGHSAVAQYNICHGKCNFIMEVDGHKFQQKAGDVCYIKAGLPHGSEVPEDGHLDYVYYELYVQERDFLKVFPEGPFEDKRKNKNLI